MVNFYLSGNKVHDRVIEAFYEGCPEDKQLIKDFEYQPSDVAVIFGVYKSKVPLSYPRGHVFRSQRKNNRDVIVLETGYINRGDGENHHYAIGFNGLNGRADFKNKNMPGDRFFTLGVEVKPYRSGKHIVLCGQVPWDASVDHINMMEWLGDACRLIRMHSGRPVVVRHHPCVSKPSRAFLEEISDAHAVVTFNSNSAVEAAIDGVPVFAFDEGSMAWAVCNKDFEFIERPWKPDRTQWLNDLAYCQWTPDEMRKGLAWKHLFR